MKMLSTIRAALASAALALALPASAAFYVDDTTGGPTYTRALVDFSDLSAVGVDVSYDVFSFSVSEAGVYTVRSFAEGLLGGDPWDQFIFLYADSFDPSAPLVNGVIASDDFNSNIGVSGFDIALSTGVAYYLVTTGWAPEESGKFLNLVRGPGEILPAIPEPDTYALLAMGLFAVAFAVRRRTQDDAV
jgi:hypothetical protein